MGMSISTDAAIHIDQSTLQSMFKIAIIGGAPPRLMPTAS
jgi:hypothetical protein